MTNRRRGRHAHTRIILENWTRKPATVGGNVSASSVIRACLSTVGSSGFRVGDFGARSEPRASNVAYPAPRAASTETQVEPRCCRAGAMETRKCRTNRDIPTFPQP